MRLKRTKIIEILLIFTVLADTLLGYPYSNILIGIIPVNETLLFLSFLLVWKNIPGLIGKYKLLIPLIIWSIFYLLRAVINFTQFGIWAFRDAMHLVEIFWVFPVLFLLENRKNINFFIYKIYKIGIVLLPFKFMAIFARPYSESITISGIQGKIPLLTSLSSLGLLVFLVFFYAIFVDKNIIRKFLVFFLFVIYVVIVQSRNVYLGIIAVVFMYIYLKGNFRTFIKIVFLYNNLFLLLLFFISKMSFLNDYTRFGIEKINPIYIAKHLLTITGHVSDLDLQGAASGVSQRLLWWNNVFNKVFSDIASFLVGLGFGIPLTDFYVSGEKLVREPHNSFVSVFARTGIVGFLLWIVPFSLTILLSFRKLKKNIKKLSKIHPIASVSFVFVYVFLLALSEPSFELPFAATVIYVYWAIIYFGLRKEFYGYSLYTQPIPTKRRRRYSF